MALKLRAMHAAALIVAAACVLGAVTAPAYAAKEDIEFVAEHLAESAMDNRFAGLPVWAGNSADHPRWSTDVQAAFATTSVGGLESRGPMYSVAVLRELSPRWSIGGLAFVDVLHLSASRDLRPLDPLFSRAIPLALPADAVFSQLDGSARDIGLGVFMKKRGARDWLGERTWIGGLIGQRLSLRAYRFQYQLLSGLNSEAAGTIDYSAHYVHFSPFAGMQWHRAYGIWSLSPHLLAAWPLPRRGVRGCIAGGAFDVCGDTAQAGHGKHFGDPYLALGLGVTYEPWKLTVELGGALSQAFVEPLVHKGIDRNWLLSFDRRF